jgi:hypothetical protein
MQHVQATATLATGKEPASVIQTNVLKTTNTTSLHHHVPVSTALRVVSYGIMNKSARHIDEAWGMQRSMNDVHAKLAEIRPPIVCTQRLQRGSRPTPSSPVFSRTRRVLFCVVYRSTVLYSSMAYVQLL